MGTGDHSITPGQARIATEKTRDIYDHVIVTEKLDGANVGIARINNQIVSLSRAGYPAISSPYIQHRYFAVWVMHRTDLFLDILEDGERIVGEWLAQAHGTRYKLEGYPNSANNRSPFVAFDLMRGHERALYDEFIDRIKGHLFSTPLLHRGGAFSIRNAMALLGKCGFYGAMDQVEGAVWRVEREWPTGKKRVREARVDFLAKYVHHDKVAGRYWSEMSGEKDIWNWRPKNE